MPKRLTPFMIFVKDYQKNNRQKITINKAIDDSGKIWQKMSAEERRPYSERASPHSAVKTDGKPALNTFGTPVAHLLAEKKNEQAEDIRMKREIDLTVRMAMNHDELEYKRFNVIMFNYFNKTNDGESYLPAEVSVCQFSLKEGIINFTSTLINPDTVIFGTLYDVKQHSLNTHGLPIPPDALGEKDMRKVYLDILNLIERDCDENGVLPPVYTFTDHIPLVSSCLDYLYQSAPDEPEIRVYSIHYLFYQMKWGTSKLAEIDPPNNQFLTNTHLERDFFEYNTGLACEFHETHDRSKYCTQSRVIRWCYTFFDYMCADLDIPLIPVRHAPANVKPNYQVNEPKGATTKKLSAWSFLDVDESSIDSTILKLESLKIGNSSSTNSSYVRNTLKPSFPMDNENYTKPKVLSDATQYTANLNDNKDFPVLSSSKKKPKTPNSDALNVAGATAAATANLPTKQSAVGKMKWQPKLVETDSDDSILPSSTYSSQVQSLTNSSVSGGSGRGYGKFSATKTNKHFGGAGRGWFQ